MKFAKNYEKKKKYVKWLEKSLHSSPEKSVVFTKRPNYDIFIKHYKVKNIFKNVNNSSVNKFQKDLQHGKSCDYLQPR